MRTLFENARKRLETFVEQRDKAVMILSAEGLQIAYVIKLLTDIEAAGSPDVFLIFPQDFESSRQLAALVVERIRLSYEAAGQEAGIAGEIEKTLPFPAVCLDEGQPPARRIREALVFARSLLLPNQGQRLIFGLLPVEVKDPEKYRDIVLQLIAVDKNLPWFRGMRLLIREEHVAPMLPQLDTIHPFLEQQHFDLSTAAMTESLREEARDPELPAEQRAQSLLQLACIDYAHQRYADAMEKYSDLLAYYQQTGNVMLQAMVLNGIGDVYGRMKNLHQARDWYERALVPAGESAHPIILFTVARNLGHIYYDMKNYEQAEVFFDGAQQLGLHTHDPDSKIVALEWRGLSQQKQKQYARAADSFEAAVLSAVEFDRAGHVQRNLEHLEKLLKRCNQQQRLQAFRYQLNAKQRERDNESPGTPVGHNRAADAPAAV